jgi:hypothetical protein
MSRRGAKALEFDGWLAIKGEEVMQEFRPFQLYIMHSVSDVMRITVVNHPDLNSSPG